MATLSVNVTSFVDARKVSPFQILIVVLCFLIVAIDGFDTAAIGFIAPAIRAEWNLSPAQLAPLFGAGRPVSWWALLFGPLADRIGASGFCSCASCSSARRAWFQRAQGRSGGSCCCDS
jgi:AAHS family 4-hydroxybenzoate transporter-like MFS transporter